jgi:hypothetical protein
MDQRTWAGMVGRARRLVSRHKLAAAITGLCAAAGVAGIAWAGLSSPAAAADPAAAAFSLPALGRSGHRISLSDYAGRPLIVNFLA